MVIERYSCVKECAGCYHSHGTILEEIGDHLCSLYQRPAAKWRKLGGCENATHRVQVRVDEPKKRVGQQKQKKDKK